MAFDSLVSFLDMGRHGMYVWSAYGIGLALLMGLIVQTFKNQCAIKKTLKQRYMNESN